jgi:FKBP-type peptidyl-prolyl cis-trans isomerase
MKYWSLMSLGCFCMIISCKHQTPQLPANKGIKQENTEAQTLLTINQNLAAREDSSLKAFVDKHYKGFQRSNLGFWYQIENTNPKGSFIQAQGMFTYQYELLSLEGKILENGITQAALGKKELITGLEEGIKMLKIGGTGTFIIPSYIAFGRKGKDNVVDPYTPVIYKIKLLDSSCKSN